MQSRQVRPQRQAHGVRASHVLPQQAKLETAQPKFTKGRVRSGRNAFTPYLPLESAPGNARHNQGENLTWDHR